MKADSAVELSTSPLPGCHSEDPLPPRLPNCPSCRGRCGKPNDIVRQKGCSCDSACVAYRDCCSDFRQMCPTEAEASTQFNRDFLYSTSRCLKYRTKRLTHSKMATKLKTLMVSACGRTGEACAIVDDNDFRKNSDLSLVIPIYDRLMNVHYVNSKCALCNNLFDPVPWEVRLDCPADFPVFKTTEAFFSLVNNGSCSAYYIVPTTEAQRGCHEFMTASCPGDCLDTRLNSECHNEYQSYTTENHDSQHVYKNVHCAVCAGMSLDGLHCGLPHYSPGFEFDYFKTFSLSLLMDFDTRTGLVVGGHEGAEAVKASDSDERLCLQNILHRWLRDEHQCHVITCPRRGRLLYLTCYPIVEHVRVVALVHNLVPDGSIEESPTIRDQWKELGYSVTVKVNEITEPMLGPNDRLVMKPVLQDIANGTFEISIKFKYHYTSDSSVIRDIRAFQEPLRPWLKTTLMKATFYNSKPEQTALDVTVHFVYEEGVQSACTWLEYRQDQMVVEERILYVSNSNRSYGESAYEVTPRGANVCVNITSPTPTDSTTGLSISPALGIVSVVFLSLSLLCLLIRIALQCVIPGYKTHAGRLKFHLCVALFLAFLLLLVGGVFANGRLSVACVVSGGLMYWCFLAAFAWMTLIALDTWTVFRPAASMNISPERKNFVPFLIAGWFGPLVVAAVVFVLDFVKVESRYQPQFGARLCWINQRFALLLYFGVPVALSCFTNLVFFSLTAHYIHKTFKEAGRNHQSSEQNDFLVYIRLFILMGTTWILGFVAAFVEQDWLWVIFIVLNASQGFLIFVSFVCRRNVYEHFRHPESSAAIPINYQHRRSPVHGKGIVRGAGAARGKGGNYPPIFVSVCGPGARQPVGGGR